METKDLNLSKKSSVEREGQEANNSLIIFPSDLKFRKVLVRIISNTKFDYLILLFIILSSILLILQNPLSDPNNYYYYILNLVISVVFLIEAVMKIIALGFIFNGKDSYLRS